ncbi:hypothetical protein GQ53DRAFT_651221 [Thozetella sp. PMI_491]|nr:hypothetical protein GQ53DRAFT_651221 [Thozetella sp. PMI_491]
MGWTRREITRNDTIHNSNGDRLNALTWTLTGLACVFLGMRVFCKLVRQTSLWWDDYLLIASGFTLVASSVMLTIAVELGYGLPFRLVRPKNLSPMAFCNYASGFMLLLAAIWSKTSFGVTLLRISDGWVKRLVWFCIITMNLVMGASAMFQWIQCWPTEKLWKPQIDGTCWPSRILITYNTFASAYSGSMDIVLALLPWKIVWEASIQRKEKIGLLIAMSMGVFAGAMSFLKIFTVSSVGSGNIDSLVEATIFGTAEPAVTIMAVSVPVLRAILKDLRPKRRRRPGFVQLDG